MAKTFKGLAVQEACERFIRLIEAEAYFEAHEALEAHWFPRRFEKSDEVRLLRGFINASVAFELLKRGRPEAAARAWGVYTKYRPLLEGLCSSHLSSYRRVDVLLRAKYAELFGA